MHEQTGARGKRTHLLSGRNEIGIQVPLISELERQLDERGSKDREEWRAGREGARCEKQMCAPDRGPGQGGWCPRVTPERGSCGGFQALGVSHHVWAGGAGCAVPLE